MQPNTTLARTSQDRLLTLCLILVIAALAVLAFWKSSERHLHIDEPHNVFTMQLVMAWNDPGAGNPVDLHHVIGGLITRGLPDAGQHYLVLRVLFAMGFVLTMLCVGFARPVASPSNTAPAETRVWWYLAPSTIALAMGAGWLHGFEIRHDLFQAGGIVAIAALIHAASSRPHGWGLRWLAAVTVVIMQLTSHKAFTLWLPALLLLAFTAGSHSKHRDEFPSRCLSLILEFGRLTAACTVVALLGMGVLTAVGALDAYLDRLRDFANYSTSSTSFSSSPTTDAALIASPVASFLAAVGLCAVAVRFSRQWKVSWLRALDSIPVSVVMLPVCVVALAINPKPYSYNLVWLSPGLALAAAEGLQTVLGRWWNHRILVVTLLVSTSLLTLLRTTGSTWSTQTMEEQMRTIAAVESLTAPDDTVLDGTGLVSSRKAPTRDWILHSLFMPDYHAHKREQFADVIEREYPPVIVRGHYRWGWLTKRDKITANTWYKPVSPTLWVLGYDLDNPSGAVVEIRRPGRYEIAGASQLDGRPILSPSVHHLMTGAVQLSGPGRVTVRWIGPNLKSLNDIELPQTLQLYLGPSTPLR